MSIFRYVRGCVFALFAIAMFGATATAAEKLTVRLSWTPFGLQSPFHLANQMGWFQAEGLDVHVEDGKGSAVTVQLMGTNRYDIGHGSLANMAMGRDKGMKLVAIGGGDIGLIVAKSSGVKSAKDLVGKKLVYTPGSLETPFLDPFLKNIGMTRSQLTLMAVDAPAKVATFMTGRADGVFTAFPFFIPLLRDRKPSVYFKFADHGLRLPGVGLIAHEDTIKEKPEALRKFMKVFQQKLAGSPQRSRSRRRCRHRPAAAGEARSGSAHRSH